MIEVYKFGGASVKDAEGVKNIGKILLQHRPINLVVVVSAMGKMTNALEKLTQSLFDNKSETETILSSIKQYHLQIAQSLFDSKHSIFNNLEDNFAELHWATEEEQLKTYDYEYDQIVAQGELLSTKIVAAYLQSIGLLVHWCDARDIIHTDDQFRDANVDWDLTQNSINEIVKPALKQGKIVITQGFIGSTSENFNTTLGREGSDYSAAILAFCLDAEKVSIWKDVAGVLNADPKIMNNAILIPNLSFQDAVEMAFFGATIIHPKTIKPLQNKNIPLQVKSFLEPEKQGTTIGKTNEGILTPSYIVKDNQTLISITPKDFSFVVEEHLSALFGLLAKHKVKTNLMINSALSFSICVGVPSNHWNDLLVELSINFKVKFNNQCTLLTIRQYHDANVDSWIGGKEILLEQKTRTVAQYVIR